MNRSILIVICDFLLVSLLAFSTVDINKVGQAGPPQVRVDIATNSAAAESGRDLAAVMRLSLEQEKQRRDLLMSELTATRATVGQQQQELESRAQQLAEAQNNIQNLNGQVRATEVQSALTNEKLNAAQADLERWAQQAAALQQQLAQSSQSNAVAMAERQRLAGELELAGLERQHAAEQVASMQDQLKTQRAENAKLAEGVQALAAKSGELTQEIRENRPLASNTLFNDFVSNRVEAGFTATHKGLFGTEPVSRKQSGTVLVTDGTNTFALCHVDDTPLALAGLPGIEWTALQGTLARNAAQVEIRSLSFHQQDPRVVFMPLTGAEARQLGGNVYGLSSDPFKFQDAVLVGTREDYYGECSFQIDTSTPGYVKLDRSVVRGLFGKFNPSRGDLVLSRRGELLGVMVNSTYCLMLHNFNAAMTVPFGPDVRDQQVGDKLAMLYSTVQQMPFKLQ
jgi:hypothetical protein